MQLFVIGTQREKRNGVVLKFRVLDLDSKKCDDLTPEELTELIDKNEKAFKNIFKEKDKHGQSTYRFDIGVRSLPVIGLDGQLLSTARYVALSKTTDIDEYILSSYSGNIVGVNNKDMKAIAENNEIANIEISKCSEDTIPKILRITGVLNY